MNCPSFFTVGLLAALSGCVHTLPPETPESAQPSRDAQPTNSTELATAPATIRQGRYTLASTQPTLEQRQPLLQIIDVRIAPALAPTVGDALQYVLRHSGYSQCASSPDLAVLFSRPLPAVHYQLGPMPLMEALTILAGPAWTMQTDPVARSVCFTLLPTPAHAQPAQRTPS